MKQTAVEFLEQQLYKAGWEQLTHEEKMNIFCSAKLMEQEQIKHAYNSDRPNLCAFTEGTAFKEYHNENFKP